MWLILDVSNLAWRAYHVLGGLSYKGSPTGILFGIFRDILFLTELYDPEAIAFCFDSKTSIREQIYPNYKITRRLKSQKSSKEYNSRASVHNQIVKLRKDYLPFLGYQNMCISSGYEADDLIAALCLELGKTEEAVIVTSDQDMYQLINGPVRVWDARTKRTWTLQSFKKKYRILPSQWIYMKAIMGCETDDVEGIKGVGEVYALRYLRGELPKHYQAYKHIESHKDIIERNLRLVKIPFEGTPSFVLSKDAVRWDRWAELMDQLGMRSLARMLPRHTQRRFC